MAGRKDIARIAGVSTTTVTRVLSKNGAVSKQTVDRVQAAVNQLGYTRNVIASNFSKTKKSNVIALLVPDMTNYYYMEMFGAMVREARKRDATISIYSIATDKVDDVVDEVIANRVSGIVNMGLVPITRECYRRVVCGGIRFIYPGFSTQDNFSFSLDHTSAISDAVNWLKATGCKKIGFLFCLNKKLMHDARIRCFRESMAACGCEFDESSVILGTYPHGSAAEIAYKKTKELFADTKPFDALFCLNDMMAIGAARAIQERGLKIPQDVSIIGFDGIGLNEYLVPSISTIKGDIELEARSYVKYCLDELEIMQIEVKSKFLPRSSVKSIN